MSALLQNRIGRPSTSDSSVAIRPSLSSVNSPRLASQISTFPSGSHSSPSGRPPVSASVVIVFPSALTRRMRPSYRPVSTLPSSSISVSSGPSPGNATVRTSIRVGSRFGGAAGGVQRTGEIDDFMRRH